MTSIHIMTLGNNIPNKYKTKVGITNNDLKEDGNNHLLSIIANTPEFSIFHNLIKLSKTEHIFNDTLNNNNMVNHNLNNSSTYTVFVPNNSYFDNFSYFLSEIDFITAREIVLYHVLKNTYDYDFFLGNSYRLRTISTNPMNQKLNVYSKKLLKEYRSKFSKNNNFIFNISPESGKFLFQDNDNKIQELNPTLQLIRGMTYTFKVDTENHPFNINTINALGIDNRYENGIENNGTANGTIIFNVPFDAPYKLFYNCQYHSSMNGEIYIVNQNTDDSIEYIDYIFLSNGRSIKHKKYSKHHMTNEVMIIGEVDKTATNGKIYVIDGLLKPPCCN